MAYTERYVTQAAAGGGDGTSGDPWTLQEACDNAADGDRINVKADGVYVAEYDTDGAKSSVMYISTVGTVANGGIHWRGYHTTIGDGGIVTINADTNNLDNAAETSNGLGNVFNIFENFNFKGANNAGFDAGTDDEITFKNCRFADNGDDGFTGHNGHRFVNCLFENNTACGVDAGNNCDFFCCVAQNNADGFEADGTILYYKCLAYNNSGNNIRLLSIGEVLDSTIDGEDDSDYGIFQDNASNCKVTVINCITHDCSVGIKSDIDVLDYVISRHNLFNSHTADVDNWLAPSAGDGTGNKGDVVDPGTNPFNDEAGDDYSAASSAQALGIDANFTKQFWSDYNDGAGDNPPAE